MLGYQTYWLSLTEAARDLTGGEDLPVNLKRVCQQLGVRVVRARNQGNIQLLLSENKPEIRIPYDGAPYRNEVAEKYTALIRYWVAHELGHLLLIRKHSVGPCGVSEYWKHETLCNRFAAHLLLPEAEVKSRIELTPDDPNEHLKLCDKLSMTALTPWETTALRVTDMIPHVNFLSVKSATDKRRESILRIVYSTCINRKGIRTHITADSTLGRELRRLRKGEYRSLDPALFGTFKSLAFLKDASSASVVFQPNTQIRLAVLIPGQNLPQIDIGNILETRSMVRTAFTELRNGQ